MSARFLPAILFILSIAGNLASADDVKFFQKKIAPIFQQRCVSCHQQRFLKGGLDLSSLRTLLKGGESGPAIVPGRASESLLLDMIAGDEPEMPKTGKKLTPQQIKDITKWIADGAQWPKNLVLRDARYEWWSFQPLQKPAIPTIEKSLQSSVRNPIDNFIFEKQKELGLRPSAEADRRTLIRRLTYDLHGLPPTPEEIDAFINDKSPRAYEKLVDRLLASPRYGERWARHWLDVVHYGDTHGYDKDKRRPNAWPYRDYVIRAFNEDKPYSRFVKEQLAGDVLYPGNPDGVIATGFIVAGPWDYVGHVELREGTVDKKITRNLDRDDIVTNTMLTFNSLTVQCARCHNHKFDPIYQEEYYSLQAVFAGIERANRSYDADTKTAMLRKKLAERQQVLLSEKTGIEQRIRTQAGKRLPQLERQIAILQKNLNKKKRPEFGYHSQIEKSQNVTKWVQIDLEQVREIEKIVYVACHDTFAGIGAGFGFPVRYKIQLSNDANFQHDVIDLVNHTTEDVPNPGIQSQSVDHVGKHARYLRITATKLAPRQNDYIFAMGEVSVFDAEGKNLSTGKIVTSLDSIEAPVRWQKKNLVDGYYFGVSNTAAKTKIANLEREKKRLLKKFTSEQDTEKLKQLEMSLRHITFERNKLPKMQMVYAAANTFSNQGNFAVSPQNKPRPIHLLKRGSVKSPGKEVGPGTVALFSRLPARFSSQTENDEGGRRAALANWIANSRNPLTWRSIVNRVWQYHFGKGLVSSPNDFGHMGAKPTHPKLLDWMAINFRDGHQSMKELHRLIVTSAVYRQVSASNPPLEKIDKNNRYLWRGHRQRLDAESIRDTVLAVSGKLDLKMYGPGYDLFGFKDDHSPHYWYDKYNVDDAKTYRRTVYRFVVRSVPDPFMETLDCADPSQQVARRNQTITALQSLALLNNRFMVRQAEHFANRLKKENKTRLAQIRSAYRLSLGREPTKKELAALIPFAKKHGLKNLCRLIFNLNEFVFVD